VLRIVSAFSWLAVIGLLPACVGASGAGDADWRSLPLIQNGRVAGGWTHIGWGGFAIDGDSLRTDCDEKGMGLLLYEKEKFGNCQIRIVYKTKDDQSNSGIFVRIDDGIVEWKNRKSLAIHREPDGKLSKEMLAQLMNQSEKEEGPWYAVHHGYEVQILPKADEYHRSGAIYSLAKAAPAPKTASAWQTMVITLKANLILVDIDGKHVTAFDPDSKAVPLKRQWFEPKREPKRPQTGYIGLQNHDPGDVVYFKEVSVRSSDGRR
jgi:3-keto-disaccharide hydrolase